MDGRNRDLRQVVHVIGDMPARVQHHRHAQPGDVFHDLGQVGQLILAEVLQLEKAAGAIAQVFADPDA